MNKTSFHVLRVGTGITFLWIGLLILKDPLAWGGFIQPWMMKLLPFSVESTMISIGILDIIIGALLIFDVLVWLAGLLGALHMVMVIAVSGINEATVRDIAIFAGALAIFIDGVPKNVSAKLYFWKKNMTQLP